MGVLHRLLAPASIAVVGGAAAERVVAQCVRLGFDGTVWPVHPARDDMVGIGCVAAVELLPSPPDAVFIDLEPGDALDVVRSLAAMGAGGAVLHRSSVAGSLELLDGLIDAAGAMPLLGPGSLGHVSGFDRVALWPEDHTVRPCERGAAIVSQSDDLGRTLALQQRGLRLGSVIALGEQGGVATEDAIDALLDDERVTAIGLFVETVTDPIRFADAACRAHDLAIPVVALRAPRVARGATLAAALDALLARNGIATVTTPAELIETLKLLDGGGPLAGHRIVAMSRSRGAGSLLAAQAETTALVLDTFDAGTSGWGDRAAMARCFSTVMEGDQDATVLVVDAPASTGGRRSWEEAVDALGDAARASGGRAVVVATMPECLDTPLRDQADANGLAPLLGVREALAALDAAAFAGTPPRPLHAPVTRPPATRPVDEGAAKARLRYLGLPVPEGRMVLREDIAAAAGEVGYPVTLKGLGIANKSEVGAVHVGLPDEAALLAAAGSMSDDMVRFLVETTVTDVVAEVLVAVRREPPVGWLVTLGFGGVTGEVWHDVTHLLAPVTVNDVVAALARLRSAALLTGSRGRPAADVGALGRLVVTVVDTVVGTAAVEVELNPVLVGRQGAIIADALWVEEAPA